MEHLVPEKNSLDLELKDDANSIFSGPYPVPKVHKEIFKREI